jgi:hypothetical protein
VPANLGAINSDSAANTATLDIACGSHTNAYHDLITLLDGCLLIARRTYPISIGCAALPWRNRDDPRLFLDDGEKPLSTEVKGLHW